MTDIPHLPLAFIGWFFTLISGAALALGALLIAMLLRAGDLERRYLSYSYMNDIVLAAVWVLGLAGGIGVVRLQPWGRYLLELFCWALIVLMLLSAATRLYALRRPEPNAPSVNWLGAIAGLTLILIPVIALCTATIVTLRSPEALKAFS
ncbi:MAG TPA: hypothetical protein VFK92_16950 [Burkholderiales bacterium]|nr:hypothetical protein [Burkholderiales bacterium]